MDIELHAGITQIYNMQQIYIYSTAIDEFPEASMDYSSSSTQKTLLSVPKLPVIPAIREQTFSEQISSNSYTSLTQADEVQTRQRGFRKECRSNLAPTRSPLTPGLSSTNSSPPAIATLSRHDKKRDWSLESLSIEHFQPNDAPQVHTDRFNEGGSQLQFVRASELPQLPFRALQYSLQCDYRVMPTGLETEYSIPGQPLADRQKNSEHEEPGSARAIYLAKNRKAASKCRYRQKKKEQELVETARHAERKNKALKAEVELLKGGIRDLMDIAGQHSKCFDTRLADYVQREADRLAAGGIRCGIKPPASKTP